MESPINRIDKSKDRLVKAHHFDRYYGYGETGYDIDKLEEDIVEYAIKLWRLEKKVPEDELYDKVQQLRKDLGEMPLHQRIAVGKSYYDKYFSHFKSVSEMEKNSYDARPSIMTPRMKEKHKKMEKELLQTPKVKEANDIVVTSDDIVVKATGEADQDYDHEFYDEVVKQLEAAGFPGARHREFDKYQGVYLTVPDVDKFWTNDVLFVENADVYVLFPEKHPEGNDIEVWKHANGTVDAGELITYCRGGKPSPKTEEWEERWHRRGSIKQADEKPILSWDEGEMQEEEIKYIKTEGILDKEYIFDDNEEIMEIYEKVKDKPNAIKLFWAGVKKAGLENELNEKIQSSVYKDTDLFNIWAEGFWETLDGIVRERATESNQWYARGTGMGWQGRSGEKFFTATDGKEFMHNIMPDTDVTMYIYETSTLTPRTLKIVIHHHDAPMGETYLVDPINPQYETINDAADKYEHLSGLAEGNTAIWYAKKFHIELNKIDLDKLDETHVLIGKVKETDLNKVFYMMQAENWSPKGEALKIAVESGTDHTSMSVGDIIMIDEEPHSKVFYVDAIGFKRIYQKTEGPSKTEQWEERWHRRSSMKRNAFDMENIRKQIAEKEYLMNSAGGRLSGVSVKVDNLEYDEEEEMFIADITVSDEDSKQTFTGMEYPKAIFESIDLRLDPEGILADITPFEKFLIGVDEEYGDEWQGIYGMYVADVVFDESLGLEQEARRIYDSVIEKYKRGEIEADQLEYRFMDEFSAIAEPKLKTKLGPSKETEKWEERWHKRSSMEKQSEDSCDDIISITVIPNDEWRERHPQKAIDRLKPLPSLWFENDEGDKYFLSEDELKNAIMPEDYPLQHFLDAEVVEEMNYTDDRGHLMTGHKTINCVEPIVLYLVLQRGWKMTDAIVVAAETCERCLNILLEEAGDEKYDQKEKDSCHTHCELCAIVDPEYDREYKKSERWKEAHPEESELVEVKDQDEMVKESASKNIMRKARAIAGYMMIKAQWGEEFKSNQFVIFTQDCQFKMDQLDAMGEIKENMIGKVKTVTDDGITIEIGKQEYSIPYIEAYRVLEPFRAHVIAPESEGEMPEGEEMPIGTQETGEEGTIPAEGEGLPGGSLVRPEIGTERGRFEPVPIRGPKKPLEKALEVETVLKTMLKKMAITDPRQAITKGTPVRVEIGGKLYQGKVVNVIGNDYQIRTEEGKVVIVPLEALSYAETPKKEVPKEMPKEVPKPQEAAKDEFPVGSEVWVSRNEGKAPYGRQTRGFITEIKGDEYTVRTFDKEIIKTDKAHLKLKSTPKEPIPGVKKVEKLPYPVYKYTKKGLTPVYPKDNVPKGTDVYVEMGPSTYVWGRVVEQADDQLGVKFLDGTSDYFPRNKVYYIKMPLELREKMMERFTEWQSETEAGMVSSEIVITARQINFGIVPLNRGIRDGASVTVLPCTGETMSEEQVPIEHAIEATYRDDFGENDSVIMLEDGRLVVVRNDVIIVDENDMFSYPKKQSRPSEKTEKWEERWHKRSNQEADKMDKVILGTVEISDQMLDDDGMWLSKDLWKPLVEYRIEMIEQYLYDAERGINIVSQVEFYLKDLNEILKKVPRNQMQSAESYVSEFLEKERKTSSVLNDILMKRGDGGIDRKKPLKELNKIIKKRDKEYVKEQKDVEHGSAHELDKPNVQQDINFGARPFSARLKALFHKRAQDYYKGMKVDILSGIHKGEQGIVKEMYQDYKQKNYRIQIGDSYVWLDANQIKPVEIGFKAPEKEPEPAVTASTEFSAITSDISAGFKQIIDEIEHSRNPYVVSDIGKKLYKKENKENQIVREGSVSR